MHLSSSSFEELVGFLNQVRASHENQSFAEVVYTPRRLSNVVCERDQLFDRRQRVTWNYVPLAQVVTDLGLGPDNYPHWMRGKRMPEPLAKRAPKSLVWFRSASSARLAVA